MSNLTLDRLKAWLADEKNQIGDLKARMMLGDFIKRKPFITRNGYSISIQMSDLHNCVVGESVEMWMCPPSPLLAPYGSEEDPYSYVPLEVVAGYIDSLETLPPKETP